MYAMIILVAPIVYSTTQQNSTQTAIPAFEKQRAFPTSNTPRPTIHQLTRNPEIADLRGVRDLVR